MAGEENAGEERYYIVIPAIMDEFRSLAAKKDSPLKDGEFLQLQAIVRGAPKKSTTETEIIRMRCAAMYATLFSSRAMRWADIPYVSELMLEEVPRIGLGQTATPVLCFAAVYRVLIDKLILAGPRMHEPIFNAARSCSSCLHALHGVTSGFPHQVAEGFVQTAMFAVQRDRKEWLRQIEDALKIMATVTDQKQLRFSFQA